MSSNLRAPRRRRWTLAAAGGAVVVLVGGGATAAFAASTASAPATSAAASSTCSPRVGALLRALPQTLRSDLQHLRAEPKAARAADRAEIRKKALAGAYGVEVQRVAAIAAGSPGHLPAALPAALKADLKTLSADPKGSTARKAEAATIVRRAVAGDYGSTLQAAAKRAEARAEQRCAAKAPGAAS